MKHDYEAALRHNALNPKATRTKEVYDQFCVIYKDEITRALKLAAKLEQEPSKGMILAAENWYPENLHVYGSSADIGIFQAMLDQARKEIE